MTIKNCIGMAKQSKATAKSGLSGRSLKRRVIISPTGGNREERWTLLYKSVLELLLGDLTFSALLSMDDLVSLSKCCRSSRCFNQQIHTLSRWSGDFKGKLLSGKLPKLRRIKSDRPIGDCGVPGLVDLVTSVPKLDSLDVSGNCLSSAGAADLLESISQPSVCPNLLELNLFANNAFVKGAEALAMVIQQPSSFMKLHSLNLVGNLIQGPGMSKLAAAFEESNSLPNLTSLYLGSNAIGNVGARALAKALANPITFPKLEVLDLQANGIHDAEGRLLILAIQQRGGRKVFSCFNLSGNSLGNETSVAVVEGIQMRTISERLCLDLTYNFISDTDLRILSNVLSQSGTYENVSISPMRNRRS